MAHPPQKPEDISGDEALARDNQLLELYEPQIIQAAEQAVAQGADPNAILHNLIADMPANLKQAVARRFQYEVDKLRQNRTSVQRREEERAAVAAGKKRFSLRQAALLMATGAFDRIRALISRRPEIDRAVRDAGNVMMKHGVNPDMVLLERLEQIQTQAQLPGKGQGRQGRKGR